MGTAAVSHRPRFQAVQPSALQGRPRRLPLRRCSPTTPVGLGRGSSARPWRWSTCSSPSSYVTSATSSRATVTTTDDPRLVAGVDGDLGRPRDPLLLRAGQPRHQYTASGGVAGAARGQRGYYHFLYKDMLFLMVSTEDPTKDHRPDLSQALTETAKALGESYEAVQRLRAEKRCSPPRASPRPLEMLDPSRSTGTDQHQRAQVEYFRNVLAKRTPMFDGRSA